MAQESSVNGSLGSPPSSAGSIQGYAANSLTEEPRAVEEALEGSTRKSRKRVTQPETSHPEVFASGQTTFPQRYTLSDHGIVADLIDFHARQIIRRLIDHGFVAYIVGGGVRDLLLGKSPKDFDIATDATPRRIKGLFSNSRIIGRRFQLIHIFFYPGPKIFEVSTFRDSAPVDMSEGEESLHLVSDNKFGTEVTDAYRRDLTINGLFYDPLSETIVDYVGGMGDLRKGLVRIIGEPDVRFAEDPVRLLRVVRHAARSGFAIEEKTRESLEKNRLRILESSPVRVFDELRKDMISGCFVSILRLLVETGLSEQLFPLVGSHSVAPQGLVGEVLERLDDRHRAGEELPSSLTLSLLALTSRVDDHENIGKPPFVSYVELTEYLDQFFSSLAVPRRERERIHDVLLLWNWLLSQAEGVVCEGVVPSMISRQGAADILEFLRILPPTKHDRELHRRLVTKTFGAEAGEESEEFTPRRRRRRRGKRS